MNKRKIGIALGGGAVRGLAHIGILKVLEMNQIPVSFIAGTSMGAIVGGLYAAGISSFELEEIALNLRKGRTWELFLPSLSHSGFISGEHITKYLKTLISDIDISELNIPFRVVATDFLTGTKYIFEKGSLLDAIKASSSVPVVFTPAVIGDRILIDGGLSVPLPTSVVRDMGADVVLSVNVVPSPEYRKNVKKVKPQNPVFKKIFGKINNWKSLPNEKWGEHFINIDYNRKNKILPNILNISMQTRNIIEYNLIQMDLLTNKPDFLLEPNHNMTVGWFEFNRAEEIIKNGERAAESVVEVLKKYLQES
ncbi:MAG: patatin-like phospholipase family protein [Elusimicrobia bacterium]|nr:patatin-like phospholipase family protein [Elusimicrobiota bacterium]